MIYVHISVVANYSFNDSEKVPKGHLKKYVCNHLANFPVTQLIRQFFPFKFEYKKKNKWENFTLFRIKEKRTEIRTITLGKS